MKIRRQISKIILAVYGLVAVAIVGVSILTVQQAPQVNADFSSPAFPCDGSFFQIRTASSVSHLYKMVLDQSGNFTEAEVGPLSPTFSGFNGIGYNPLDGYIYGFSRASTGGADFHLLRINDAGVVTDMGLITGIGGTGGGPAIAGATFGKDGTLYAVQNTVATGLYDRLLTINLTTMSGTMTTTSQPIPQGDIAFDPTDGTLYSVAAGGGISRVNPTTGAVTPIGSSSFNAGSAFFDASGQLYASGNSSGHIYAINKTTGVYTRIATGPPAASSDGATCAFPDNKIDAIKSQTSVSSINLTTFRIQYSLGIKNTSTAINQNVQLVDRLSNSFSSGSPTFSIQSPPAVTSGACTVNAAYNGTTDYKLLSGTDDFAPNDHCTISLTVDVAYPSVAAIPPTTQLNTAHASSSTLGTNPGHSFTTDAGGNPVIVPPPSLLAADDSTNSSSFPTVANDDVPTPTPTDLPTTPVVSGYKSVKLVGDANGNSAVNPGDTLEYAITYRNTGNTSAAAFQITDSLPANTSYVGSSLTVTPSGSGQTGNPNASFDGGTQNTLLASPVDLVPSGMLTASFRVTVNSGFTGTLNNQAAGNGSNTTPVVTDTIDNSTSGDCQAPSGIVVPTNSIGQACTVAIDDQTTATVIQNPATLTVTKTDGATSVNPGDSLTYTVTVSNPTADSTATNLQIQDTLPSNTTFVSASNGGTLSGGVVTWNIGTIAGGASVTRTVTVQVNAGVAHGTTITNQATGSSTSDSAICSRTGSSCTGSDTTSVNNPPVITVTKTDGTTSVNPGGTLTYTITVNNTAIGSTATNVAIADTLPANVSFVSASNGGTFTGGTVSWTIPSITGGASATRTVTVQVNAGVADGTMLTNTATASISGDSGLCTRPGSSCTGTDNDTRIDNPAVVTLTKTDGMTAIQPGGTLTYTLTATNTAAGSTASNLQIQDTLPTNVTFVSASNGGTHSGGVVTWNIASLAGGSSLTRTVTVTVNSGTTDGTVLTNNAALSSSADAGLCSRSGSDCTASDTTSVTNQAVVTLAKTDNVSTAVRGQTLTYNLTVTNPIVGSTASNLVVTDTLPANVSFVSASNGGTHTGNTVTWNLSSLAGGSSTTLTVDVTVNNTVNDGDTITNNASLESTSDATLCTRGGSQCSASDATTVNIPAVITVDKTDNIAIAKPGDSPIYTITVRNTASGSNATNINLTDTLPQHLSITDISDGGTASGNVVSWNIASLAGGSSLTRTVTATVDADAPDGFTLTNNAAADIPGEPAACTASGARCNASDQTTVDVPANPVDPPSGYKTFDASGLPRLHWKMVWINDANSGPEAVLIVDPLQHDTAYIADSLHCEARGSSTTTRCEYDAVSKSVIWEGTMGEDAGATDEASAANEVVITLDVDVPSSLNEVVNQGKAYWDENGDGVLDDNDRNIANDQPVLTGDGTNINDGAGQPTVFTRQSIIRDILAATGSNTVYLAIIGLGLIVASGIGFRVRRLARQ